MKVLYRTKKSDVASFQLERTKDVKLKFNVIILKRRSRKMTSAILNNSMFNHFLRGNSIFLTSRTCMFLRIDTRKSFSNMDCETLWFTAAKSALKPGQSSRLKVANKPQV